MHTNLSRGTAHLRTLTKSLITAHSGQALNYCGIMNSPFEFYCDNYLTELEDISK